MGWETVDLAGVSPQLEPIAAGNYVFQLLGAAYDERDPGRLNVRASIVDGEFAGRKVFFSYPDPDKQDWSPRVLKRLEIALGVDSLPGEDPASFLNRAAQSGTRFASSIKVRSYTPDGATQAVSRSELNIFDVRPAA